MPKAIVLHPALKEHARRTHKAVGGRTNEQRLEEAVGLAEAINLDIVLAQIVMLSKITPATYMGAGKAEELAAYVKEQRVEVVIMDTHITPIQQRNLEKAMNCKVIDRTALILEIFGQRAHTSEGSLQVELAALEYQKSRLVRSWTHLERQRGGSGFLSGPGETQIESDRRAIRDQIAVIRRQLDKVVRTRDLHRKARKKVPYPVVALVGYTNAGKSTLFNRLTNAEVLAEDKLFATLDPTMRQIKLPSGKQIILSDTVGFISDLPTELVAAFRATLEEVVEADLLLHIRDVSHSDHEEQKKDVLEVLTSLGVEDKIEHRLIEVYNKVDKLDTVSVEDYKNMPRQSDTLVAVSALTGQGIKELLQLVDKRLQEDAIEVKLFLDPLDGKTLAWVYQHASVLSRKDSEEKIQLVVSISEQNLGKLEKMQQQ